MKLAEIADGRASAHVEQLGLDVALGKEIQQRLIVLGCLDPPADGLFGPVSRLTLALFAEQLDLPYDEEITRGIAKALLEQTSDTFLPLKPGPDLAGRIVTYMRRQRQFFARLPGCLNIVYVEGVDADGRPNADRMDQWNDRRLVVRRGPGGRPVLEFMAEATTEPGRFYTVHPLTPHGAARIAFGQYKSWRVGQHHADKLPPQRHEALVQAADVTLFRDKNKDGIRPGDAQDTGVFGINQHSGLDVSPTSIGKVSAGCLVARRDADHRAFMSLVKTDPRFLRASRGYLYMTTVIAGDDLARRVPL